MKKLIRNIYYLLKISTPYFIILNYIKNYFPNYRKKAKCIEIDKEIYVKFKSIDISKKWFSNNLFFLKRNLENEKVKSLLEIGSYEGRSAIFFADIFRESKISCVDTWSGSDEHENINFKLIEDNFDQNVKSLKDNNSLTKFKMTSDFFFNQNNSKFDFVYVDGDHSRDQVLKDLKNSWSVLNSNGFLLVDDYMWWFYKDLNNNPAYSVNKFIKEYSNQIKKMTIWHQVLIQKN